jgi:hypothetical protein
VVIRLARDQDADEGIATVLGVAGGAVRKIWLPLGPADYEVAVNAHRDKKGVHFITDIVQTGRKYQATNVAKFRLQE